MPSHSSAVKTYLGPQESFASLKSSCPSTSFSSSPPQYSQLWQWRERQRQDPDPQRQFTEEPQESSQRHQKTPIRRFWWLQEAFLCATNHSGLGNAGGSRSTSKKRTKWNNGAFFITSALSKIPPLSGERCKDQQPAQGTGTEQQKRHRSSCVGTRRVKGEQPSGERFVLFKNRSKRPRGDPSLLHIPHRSYRRSRFYTYDFGEHLLWVFQKERAVFFSLWGQV